MESDTPKQDLPILDLKDRIALHRRMAEGYFAAYDQKAVKEGATYEEWKFAADATYWSPYFGADEVIDLGNVPISVAAYATMEAKAYSIKFPDWGPVEFKCWPAENGFVMKNLFQGHTRDGKAMRFFVYSFVETNEKGEISHWETHVNGEEYSPFLDVAIGARGPFLEGTSQYLAALTQTLAEADML